jgi:N,N-dimethylformamidase
MRLLLGYADRRSARPGERIEVMVSCDAPVVRAELVRLLDGSPDPVTAPAPSAMLAPPLVAEAHGRVQPAVVGSRADLPWQRDGASDPLLVRCWFLATMPGQTAPTAPRRQVIWAIGKEESQRPSFAAVLDSDGRLGLEVDGRPVTQSAESVRPRTWYGLLVAIEQDGVSAVLSTRIGRWDTVGHDERLGHRDRMPIEDGPHLMRLAAWRTDGPAETFDGKIASPGIAAARPGEDASMLLVEGAALPTPVLAQWDPHLEPGGDRIVDTGPRASHGRTTNMPTRASTGPFWTASRGMASLSQAHDAVHFHADDVGDLGWEATHSLSLPSDLPSGVYAIRLEAGERSMHIPLFVRPTSPRADVAFLAPTNTYLAYANHRLFIGADEFVRYTATHSTGPSGLDTLVLDLPFLGRSTYDRHDDGSGVSLASWKRPLISFEPESKDFITAGPRHFPADLYIVGWLGRTGLGFDVLTDEDLHLEGSDALRPYRVIVTGSHPEYWSRPMIEALQHYLGSGGKLMYLGGNGFYWMTGIAPDGSFIEVRRGHQGTRAWDSEPGEAVTATSGELAGLWRNLGIPPQSLVGVGMAAQGWGGGRGYRRLPDSFDERVAGFFDGIDADEIVGDFGFVMGGAVGDEVDRMDHALGTPRHALRLATSETLPDQYQLVVEEVRNMIPAFGGTQCDLVRADMVWFDLPGGGEVFSVGSMSWAAALGWRTGRNNVDRLSTNVLRTFLMR